MWVRFGLNSRAADDLSVMSLQEGDTPDTGGDPVQLTKSGGDV